MKKVYRITRCNVADYGYQNAQYWQGHSTCDSDNPPDHSATGQGATQREAFRDAIEQAATMGSGIDADDLERLALQAMGEDDDNLDDSDPFQDCDDCDDCDSPEYIICIGWSQEQVNPETVEISEMSAHDIATKYGLSYCGDVNPIPHGGLFYDPSNWDKYGYADALQIEDIPDAGEKSILVERVTINKPDSETLTDAFRCCGLLDNPGEIDLSCPAVQIEAVAWYCGAESDDYEQGEMFSPDDEFAIWDYALPILKQMATE